jgi:transposase-like protein
MAGTIFEGTTLTLHKWFYAIFLFSISKNGVSAKELERSLEVTYKTAWRLGHQIRKSLRDNDVKLKGLVEIDESMYGGRSHGKHGWGAEGKVVLFGMVERGGNVRVKVVPNRQRETLFPVINKSVETNSKVHTDNYKGYYGLWKHGFRHRKKDGKAIHINSMEGYWGNFKKAMLGTHTWVSPKHLQNYLDEFQFRYNNRREVIKMFDLMMYRIAV